jgi:hypothetical protein
LADILVNALGLGSNGEVDGPRFCVEAWDELGLPPNSLNHTADQVVALLDEALRTFIEE